MHFLLPLFLLLSQTLAQVKYKDFSDGSYGWQSMETTGPLYAGQIRDAAQNAYGQMVNDARTRRIKTENTPSVMASLYIPTQQGGLLIIASSIKKARGVSAQTENICSAQHKHGNCAEMNAFSLVDAHSLNCKGSYIAAYGLQGGHLTFMAPCKDANGDWGCNSYCKQASVTPITKRSRIEGGLQAMIQGLEQKKNVTVV